MSQAKTLASWMVPLLVMGLIGAAQGSLMRNRTR